MLVCSVVLRPQRAAIVANIIEAADALDDPSLGAIFATLTDAPGNARDILDAFSGQLIVEAASAAATVDAGSAHPALVLEEISAAIATQDSTIGGPGGGGTTPRHSMTTTVFVNSDGTARQANADGTMVNL